MSKIATALWAAKDLAHLVDALARKAGIALRAADVGNIPSGRVAAWMEAACPAMGMETEPFEVWGFRIESALRAAAPAVVPVGDSWVGLLDVSRDRVVMIAPDLSLVRVPLAEFASAMCAAHSAPHIDALRGLLDECGVSVRRRDRAFDRLLRERLRNTLVATVWPLRTPPGATFAAQLSAAGVTRWAAMLGVAHIAEYLLWIVSWYLLGSDVLAGRLDAGWLMAWALCLAALVPFRLWTTWLQGRIAIAAGGLLRERLLDGALKLEADEVRREGAGSFLGRAIETEVIESLALSGGLMAGLAAIELPVACAVLAMGAAGWWHASILVVFAAAAVAMGWRYYRKRAAWTEERLAMTHHLVERMTGHRTRLAQEPAEEWHTAEDQAVSRYLALSARMDAESARLTGLLPRGWLLVGLAALGPAFLAARTAPGDLAVSLGGLLLAWQALRRLAEGLANLSGAAISWKQVAPLFHASSRAAGESAFAGEPGGGEIVLDATDLTFQHARGGAPVLDGVSLRIDRGDWVLLEGESGGGKSTLVNVLTGLRQQGSGMLLAGGLDRLTLGSLAWRRRIAAAPQYHENHVLSGPFAFNLLMGCQWPAREPEMRAAEELCRELGLGTLLDRMPGGMMQMVGETGWQLSQGERSRLFMARALLQNPEMVVLDESFAALDPANLRMALECVLRRAKTLLVVAHP